MYMIIRNVVPPTPARVSHQEPQFVQEQISLKMEHVGVIHWFVNSIYYILSILFNAFRQVEPVLQVFCVSMKYVLTLLRVRC